MQSSLSDNPYPSEPIVLAWKWEDKEPTAPFNKHPYTHLRPLFSWTG